MASELAKRSVVGVALIALAVGALVAGGPIFWMLGATAGVLMQGEWGGLLGASPRMRRLAMFAACVPLAILSPWAAGISWLAVGLIGGAVLFVALTARSLPLAAGIAYVTVPIMALLYLRGLESGLMLAAWALSLVWATDIGAYFAGRSIGGPKLAPAVSPSKTWAGLGGGVVSALILSYAFHHFGGLPQPLAAASGLLAVAAQLGDLWESWMKRRAGVKDSGTLLPGHGGVLDRLDGVVTAAPVAALLVWHWMA